MRFLALAVLAVSAAATAQASAQSPAPATLPPTLPVVSMPSPRPSHKPHAHASPHPAPFMTFTNPAPKGGLSSANGQSCNRNATAAQQRVNPITGQPQAATIVSIPIGRDSGTVASATNHQQQIEACGTHGH